MDYKKKYRELIEKIELISHSALTVEQHQIIDTILGELEESEDEKIRKSLISYLHGLGEFDYPDKKTYNDWLKWLEKQVSPQMVADAYLRGCNETEEKLIEKQNEQKNKINSYKITFEDVLALECAMKTIKITKGGNELYEMLVLLYNKIHNVYLLEKQGEQKPTQEIEPFEAEHGKYYYCIKDYFCGGRKQASKGDVVQALRGLPIMGLKDASEYFLPVNSIKCNSAWSEEDERNMQNIDTVLFYDKTLPEDTCVKLRNFLKTLKQRIGG